LKRLPKGIFSYAVRRHDPYTRDHDLFMLHKITRICVIVFSIHRRYPVGGFLSAA
jgi:hypothetical protein